MLGVDFSHRWSQTRECIAAMRELWSNPEASYNGTYVKFGPVRSYPKPAQKSGPPVLIGSLDKNVVKRVARWADGWCPIFAPVGYLRKQMELLREECAANKRDWRTLDITAMGSIPGDRTKIQEAIAEYAEAGAGRIVTGPTGSVTPDNYESELDTLAALYL